MSPAWVLEALPPQQFEQAVIEAHRRRLMGALSLQSVQVEDENFRFTANVLELSLFKELLEPSQEPDVLRVAAARAFQMGRTLPPPDDPLEKQEWLLKLACKAVLGERTADAKRLLTTIQWVIHEDFLDWGSRVRSSIYSAWLRVIRKAGWEDLDAVQEDVANLRTRQSEFEREYLDGHHGQVGHAAAWELIVLYHLAKAAELLVQFTTAGSVDNTYDINSKLDAQFDRAKAAASQSGMVGLDELVRMLSHTSDALVNNSIWGLSRGSGPKVRSFIESIVSRARASQIFELLPPQRRTLRDQGLLASGRRSVVVSLPTSSGKTLIAQFRILQALNQYDSEAGWVVYLAPTRALVNQLTSRLRRDFAPLNISVERVSPALEIDGIEAKLLIDGDRSSQFRVLVTTPEKFDLMIRGGWVAQIPRPLALVVVDEAHNINQEERGLKLELLLATVNRECRDAKFLLLTPFISNGQTIAQWLEPNDAQGIDFAVEWLPNDRAIMLSKPVRGVQRGDFSLEFETLHTNKETLTLPEAISIPQNRPLGMSWSDVNGQSSHIAAATAHVMRQRGSVVVLAKATRDCWSIAQQLTSSSSEVQPQDPAVFEICDFLRDSYGPHFLLPDLLSKRVGVHHGGLSEEARILVEWLFEKKHLDVIVATTTLAQGVNFPISGVVLASHKAGGRRDGSNMSSSDFWNIAGRAGRVDQGDIGLIALACKDETRAVELRAYVNENIGALNSTLIQMVQDAQDAFGRIKPLQSLSYLPAWSSFLQYLTHTYRQIGNHERFADQIEEVLRGTLGFRGLRLSQPDLALQLITSVREYVENLQGKPLGLVDSTGFSWETVSNTLVRVNQERITSASWDTEKLFSNANGPLKRMMGILLQVPELRKNLEEAIGGRTPDGNLLARIVSDWVQGASLEVMATRYFGANSQVMTDAEATLALSKCCQSLFGRITQTAAWGLSALQSLTLDETTIDRMNPEDRQSLRNLPARVFYGVNSDEAIALRLLGVPREAAQKLANVVGGTQLSQPLSQTRHRLRDMGVTPWIQALGGIGSSYYRAWTILEGNV